MISVSETFLGRTSPRNQSTNESHDSVYRDDSSSPNGRGHNARTGTATRVRQPLCWSRDLASSEFEYWADRETVGGAMAVLSALGFCPSRFGNNAKPKDVDCSRGATQRCGTVGPEMYATAFGRSRRDQTTPGNSNRLATNSLGSTKRSAHRLATGDAPPFRSEIAIMGCDALQITNGSRYVAVLSTSSARQNLKIGLTTWTPWIQRLNLASIERGV
jgi:hypothetical protein